MKKRIFALAIVITMLMTLLSPAAAFAEGEEYEGDVKTDIRAENNDTVKVDGNVEGKLSADNGTIIVTGNVETSSEEPNTFPTEYAVDAENGSTIEIGGDVQCTDISGVEAKNSKVNIEGTVKSDNAYVTLEAINSEVNVGGVVAENIGSDCRSYAVCVFGGELNVADSIESEKLAIYAIDAEISVENDVKGEIYVSENSDISIGGDLSSDYFVKTEFYTGYHPGATKYPTAIRANNSVVEVKGNVTGDIGLKDAKVEVGGNVSESNISIRNSALTVDGDINCGVFEINPSGSNSSKYIESCDIKVTRNLNASTLSGGSFDGIGKLTVGENLYVDKGLGARYTDVITVGGDIKAGESAQEAIHITVGRGGNFEPNPFFPDGKERPDTTGSLTVDGTINGTGDGAIRLWVDANTNELEDLDTWYESKLPEMTIYKITNGGKEFIIANANMLTTNEYNNQISVNVKSTDVNRDENPEAAKFFDKIIDTAAAAINYIVKQTSDKLIIGGTKSANNYTVANEGDKLTVSAPEGYSINTLSAGEYATVEKNEDGTYTVTVARGGDLNLDAVLEEIIKAIAEETGADVADIAVQYVINADNCAVFGAKEACTWNILSSAKDKLCLAFDFTGKDDAESFLKSIFNDAELEYIKNFGKQRFEYISGIKYLVLELDRGGLEISADGIVTIK